MATKKEDKPKSKGAGNRTKDKAAPAAKDPVQQAEPEASTNFPIVGIGASAGGLAAFEAFFSGMPAASDPGMAFVLVQHLAPDHKSILTELVRRYTRMQVFEVEDGMIVEPNCAYIIPPARDMAFLHGTLQLLEPSAPRGHRLPIDFFFRSLAQDQRERAIAIVLSGTGSDGTLGVRAIKGEGGMVMVQNPDSTEYDAMPRNAIATGMVDYVLPPAEMPAQLLSYTTHSFVNGTRQAARTDEKSENHLNKIFVLLRNQVGHDFSQYKPSTIQRRIERRMAVHQIETLADYVKYMQQNPIETEALFQDLLIGVTSFFRDPEAFKALKQDIIPKLFSGKSDHDVLRIWVPGCATGEEAYSLAILLAEEQEKLKKTSKVQIFATDVDSRAIAHARAGIYPANIAADISAERLARYFSADPAGDSYQIQKAIRDLLVFSEQDLIRDPPFSKLDLISCRNLLIYMGGELQKRIFPLFHYALNPGGYLFLGTSESVGEFSDLFTNLDRKQKLYQRKDDFYSARHAVHLLPPTTAAVISLKGTTPKLTPPAKQSLRELTEQAILRQFTPLVALVGAKGEILYLHGRSGCYLEPPPGEPGTANILKMAREGLQRELTTALHKAVRSNKVVHSRGLKVKTNGTHTTVNLTIRPQPQGSASTAETQLYLVVLEESQYPESVSNGHSARSGKEVPSSATETRVRELEQELRTKDEYLQTTNEELETSNEELKSSNEEMQSVNEELQSTNEELETSKEELQSVNEELATVNAELQNKVADLTRANNDMNNLLAGTGIATVFVDCNLHILSFTPETTRIINLLSSDVGRSIAHIVSNLVGADQLVPQTQAVLDTLVPQESDVQTLAGRWYRMHILPYRTLNNMIEGVVLTFVDITERKQTEQKLADHTTKLEQLYHQLDGEFDKARQVHERILPKSFPAVEGLSFAAHYQPAQKMGGDFYDVLHTGNKLIFYLSDVSGHGLDGAMLSVFVKHTIISYISFTSADNITPTAILRHLAEQFGRENYPEDLYVTSLMAVLDLGSMELSYCSAGLQEALLVQQGSGERQKLHSKGMFITSYLPLDILNLQDDRITLTPGSTIFCNTDGLTEQGSKEAYYRDRLPDAFFQNAHLPAHLVAQAVVEDFRKFNNGSLQGKDDITFLVLKLEEETPKLG